MEEIKKLVLISTIMLVTSIYVLSFHFFFCRGYEDIKHVNKDIECKQIEVTARLEKQEKELSW